jgi:hypothetical protein
MPIDATVRKNRTSLLQKSGLALSAGSAIGWTSLLIILFCLCLCGSAAGEFVLIKIRQKTLAITKLEERFGMTEDTDSSFSASSDEETKEHKRSYPEEGVGARTATFGTHPHQEDFTSGKLYDEYLADYWSHYSPCVAPDIFEHDNLRIVKDGGMKDVPFLRVKWWKAAWTLMACVANIVLILVTDVAAYTHNGPPMDYGNQPFLIFTWLEKYLLAADERLNLLYFLGNDMNKIVPLSEIGFLFFVFALTLVCVIGAAVAPHVFDNGGALQRWTCASMLFWHCIPQLMSCSALRLLHFVTPTVLFQDGYYMFLQSYQVASQGGTIRHYSHSLFQVVWFVMSRITALVLGFDAFLVKFRMASLSIDSGSTLGLSELAAVTFLWQIMGIIHLRWFVERRLFIFLFAGRRGNLDIDEEALIDVWKALVTRRVYEAFGFWKGSVVMISFDTYDMQYLSLEDDEEIIRSRVSSETVKSSKGRRSSKTSKGVMGQAVGLAVGRDSSPKGLSSTW